MSKYTIEQLNAMNPEEFAKVNPADLIDDENEDQAQDDVDQNDDQGNQDEDQNDQDDNQEEQQDENGDQEDQEPDPDNEDENQEQEDNENPDDEQNQEQEQENQPAEKTAETATEDAVDHAKFYEELTSEFKANGQTFKITKAEDIKRLVQQGLNYNKKMNEIRPHLNVSRLLEENGLHDVDEIAFLIDIKNGKPEAIAKLIKDKKLDAYELDEEKANSYQQTPVNIPNEQVQLLQEVVREHEGNEDFIAVFEQAKTWDNESQDQLLNNPNYLAILADHKTRGVYDKVMQQVNYLQTVQGNKTPTIQLYHAVGSQMYGGANQQDNAQAQQVITPPTKPANVKRVDPNLASRRRAVSSVKGKAKGKAAKTQLSVEDIYNMNPEDFAKVTPADFD